MLKTFRNIMFIVLILTGTMAHAQMDDLHGDFANHMNGLHAGNQFRTTFYNDGLFGKTNTSPEDIAGEWPINSGQVYLVDGNTMVGAEVIDAEGVVKQIVDTPRSSVIGQTTGQQGPTGDWWTFLPLPGFANKVYGRIAMNKWQESWPDVWPDKMDDAVDPGWGGQWNGYFGKNINNADEESYYVMDDYQNKEYAFYPDSTDLNRRGLGLRVYVRGFQWANALVQDALFTLFDIENVGTGNHDKVVFGYKIGNDLGSTMTANDSGDDSGSYETDKDFAYLFDEDNLGAGGFTPVAYFGGAFLESPGNPYDGIDNDGDGSAGPGPVLTEADFAPRMLAVGDQVVLIDYQTFERSLIEMPNQEISVQYQDLVFKFSPGDELVEIANNLVDDNLNGLIDENNGSVIGTGDNEIIRYLYTGLKYINYFTGEGSNNPLIEEKRDDGIDNDNDWDPLTDDVGMDGVAYSGDFGENDGLPTSGRGTSLPGEPHIDKTDVDETDMIGLTSFLLYEWTQIPLSDDIAVWDNIIPGYFNDLMQNSNVELLYGSGYFPIKSRQTERFSMGLIAGEDQDDLIENHYWVSKAYNENYNFAKAPNIPTLTAIPGDNQVVLKWDSYAEESVDPITGEDFEGYRIYRSTDPGFEDMKAITDGQGTLMYRKPLAQYDLDNEHSEYAPVATKGVQFWLGRNTGLTHSYVDSTVTNGTTYYYAVTSYDHGDPASGIAPTECKRFISISTSGVVEKGTNVVIARPQAPAAGFIPAGAKDRGWLENSTTLGNVQLLVVDPTEIKDMTYRITFEDSIENYSTRFYPRTKNFTLADVSDPDSPDTLISRSRNFGIEEELPTINGFKLTLQNDLNLDVNTDLSGWNNDGLFNYYFRSFKDGTAKGTAVPNDYYVVFSEEAGFDSSTAAQLSKTKKYDVQPVNFKVFEAQTNEPVKFAFKEQDGKDGVFSGFTSSRKSDMIIFLENDKNDSLVATWGIELDNTGSDSTTLNPTAGDTLRLITYKPFLSHDVYEFKTSTEGYDEELAKTSMEDIRVVPNPYIVANSWEPHNPYANGRGPRELHFTRLPQKCTIRIFTVRGQLVQIIEHESETWNGTEIWDMQSKDNLDIAYGIYVYHVDAGEIGTKIGKFALIK